jgi:hypothetical protein
MKRIPVARQILTRPDVARALAAQARAERIADLSALARLFALLDGRTMRPHRRQRIPGLILRRDPAAVARRYLRRIRGGQWHSGAHHIARHHFGPGIAWSWSAEQTAPVACRIINATLEPAAP